MSRSQLSWLGGTLFLLGLVLSFRTLTHAADPQATGSPQTWPPGQVIFEQSDTERRIRETLEQPGEFEFLDTPLGDVVNFIRKKYDISVQLDIEALAADGKGSETPITKSLRNTTLNSALHLILDGQGLTHIVKNDALLITTQSAASTPENLSTRTYQVHDLVVAANDPTASQPDFDSLIHVITSNVRQNDWADNGGTIGFATVFDGPGVLALVIKHEERGHCEIEQLLKSLRAARLQPIFDAQSQAPLRPRPQPGMYGMGMGGGMPEPAPEAPKAEKAKSSPQPAQTSGGGFF